MLDKLRFKYDCTGEGSPLAQHDFVPVMYSNADTTWSYVGKDMVKLYSTKDIK